MHPLSDKDLDRLSREAADQYDVEQNTSGWDKLEQKLNKHLPDTGKKERRRFLFLIWLLALLTGSGLFWMLTNISGPQLITLKQGTAKTELPGSKNEEAETPAQNQRDNKTIAQSEKPDNGFESMGSDNGISEKKTTKTTTPDEKVFGSNSELAVSTSKKKKLTQSTLPRKEVRLDSQREISPAVDDQSSVTLPGNVSDRTDDSRPNPNTNKQQADIGSPTSPGLSPAIPKENKQNENNLSAQASDTVNRTLAEQTKRDETDSASIVKTSDSTSSAEKPITAKHKGTFKKGLEIGLVAAPDMSNVKFTNTSDIGFNFGIQLGYRLSQRWSVNTGVLYTRKNYTSRGKDFNPAKGSWLDNVQLNMVEGDCFMYDVPLNIRYDLNSNINHRYFLSTGLSTYFMKKESYDYFYQYTNGNPGHRYRSYPSSERHWLSVLNLSAGFEKNLSRRFSLQAEPYLKIPLAGVGYGNIQLNSYGMYFSLKYKPALRSGRR